MPKSSKTKDKAKTSLKTKRKAQLEAPGITTKKSYWVMLSVVIVAVFSVAGYILKFRIVDIAVLMIALVFLIGFIGYVRITPSNLSKSKRGTFLFVGASIIGFGIWAVIMYTLLATGTIGSVFDETNVLLIIPSLVLCLTLGAFIGELMGKNSRIQKLFFKPEDTL